MKLLVKRIDPEVPLPERKTEGAAGYDLYLPSDVNIPKGKIMNIDLGIAIKVPEGHVGKLCGRSSLECRGLHVLAGLLDEDFVGSVILVIKNLGYEDVKLKKHDRIGQVVLYPVSTPLVEETFKLPDTKRGEGKFGSTNV